MKAGARDRVALFFLKFSVMISNGLPLITALEHLEREAGGQDLKQAARKMRETFEKTRKNRKRFKFLWQMMRGYPSLFDRRVVQLVKTGEETGTLDLVLRVIPEYLLFGLLSERKK